MLYLLSTFSHKVRESIQTLFVVIFLPLSANSATLQCSPQKGEATLNEVYTQNQNSNFLEVKIFDPAYSSYAGWKVLYCADNERLNQCTTSVFDVAAMTQENVNWFRQYDVEGLKDLNKNTSFTLLLVDKTNKLIDRLTVNNANLNDTVNCSFYYDTTVSTDSNPKAIRRNPDGTGDWEDSPGTGAGTVTTPGESNDGVPSVQIMADYRMDECYWDGTAGEVKDSTATPYNGTSKGDANTTVNAGGGVCYNGNFLSNYVELPTFPHINGSRTITAWFNTKNIVSGTHQRIFADDENNNNGSYALSVGDPGAGKVRFYIRGLSSVSLDSSASVVAKDTWYFAAATFNKATMKKKLYIYDASGSLLNEVSQTVTGTVGTPSGKASIGGEVVGAEVANRFNGYLDEVKIFDGALYRTEIERILNNERVGNNYDGTTRLCGCGGGTTPKDGSFNAIDLVSSGCNAAIHWNNTLSTRVINDNIPLSVLARDSATDLPMEADITKISLVHYPDGNNNACLGTALASIDVCTNCGLTDADGCLSINIDKSFNQRASKCIEVLIEGKDKEDITGTSLSESNAGDNFAARPMTYSCDSIPASVLVAQHSYPTTFNATPLGLTTPSPFYTTSLVAVNANKYMRSGDLNTSLSGAMSPSIVNFVDGHASVALGFSDVGDVGIELNDSSWANVDSDDTLETDRVIHAECRRVFRPDHFKVELTRPLLENNATAFTYLSNLAGDVNMSAWVRDLNMTITAQGEANATMQNYSDPSTKYYANTVTLSPELSLPLKHSSATKRVDLVNANSSALAGFTFINGVAVYAYADVGFNYDRSYFTPVVPFIVEGSETYFAVNVQDTLYPTVVGDDNTSSDANATFYYGRLRANDIETTSAPASNPIYFEVYNNANTIYTQGMKQTSLLWYVNNLHAGDGPGSIIEASASSNTLIDAVLSGFSFTYPPVFAGIEALGITSSVSQKAMIHLATQEWLWYVPSGFGSAYDAGVGSDCTMHPCFKFSLKPGSTGLMIQSGDFNGTRVPDESRGDYLKKGIKVFR